MMMWVSAPGKAHAIHVVHPFLEGMLNVVACAHGGVLPREYEDLRRWTH